MTRSHGKIVLLLHAHLPYVRHPEYERFLEENWLYEAISETYLPLLRVLRGLDADQVPCKLAISISPTLLSMLTDELLQQRCIDHIERQLELAGKEVERTSGDPEMNAVARMYQDLYTQNRYDFVERYGKDLAVAFASFQKSGQLELLTTLATHAYVPLYHQYPEALHAQVATATALHESVFRVRAKGMWLPECGYYPDVEELLKRQGIKYFFAATHGVLFSENKPHHGAFRPVKTPAGLCAIARDVYSAKAVWSDTEGYPADYTYRDFYRDIGYDLPLEYIGPYVHESHIRTFTGFKYHAITGRTDDKRVYKRDEALARVKEHAENFVYRHVEQFQQLNRLMDDEPVIAASFDAELFGHWWFEGPDFLDAFVRRLAESEHDISLAHPSDTVSEPDSLQTVTPAFSSWGNKGYSEVWLDGSNDWVYRHTHMAIERMCELVQRFPDEKGLSARALNQAAREVLLSQASDWPFIMRAGTTVPYAVRRVKEHIANFQRIYDAMCEGNLSTEWLTKLERRNNLFPFLDYRVFGEVKGPASARFLVS